MSKAHAFPITAATVLVAAVIAGSVSGAVSPTAAIQPPASIASSGTLRLCVDVSYPPAEYYAKNGSTPLGTDIAMSQQIGRLFGVKVQFVNTPFSSIIAALLAKKCDAVVSALTDTPERRKQVAFVDYLKVNSAFLVTPGNPKGIHKIGDLCGKAIAIISGENWQPFLEKQSATCSTQGKGKVTISTLNTFADELQQLGLHRVDAIATSTVNGAYIVTQKATKGKVELAKPNVAYSSGAWGIALNKSDVALKAALVKAIRSLNASGGMRKIFVANHLADAYVPAKP
jgi:polar amino acid transport system substrate-binding protein